MKITKQELKNFGACQEGFKRFIVQTNNTDEPVEVISLIGGENTVSDLLWLAGKILSKEKIVRFACDCALLNIELIRPYMNNFNLIQDFLNNPSQNAAYAADAAYAAAYAADTADAADAADINKLLVKLFTE